MPNDLTFDFPIDTSRLVRAFDNPDDIGAIVRTHYELDRALSHVLAKFYSNPKKLGANRVGPKIERLEALGFGGPRIAAIRCIDDLRNAVAHRDKEEINGQDLMLLRRHIDALTGGRFSDQFTFTYVLNGIPKTLKYGDMSIQQQFCMLAFTAIAALAALPHEVEAARSAKGSQAGTNGKEAGGADDYIDIDRLAAVNGIPVLPSRGVVVTKELIDRLIEESGE